MEHRRRESCHTVQNGPVLAVFEIGKICTSFHLSFSILLIFSGTYWGVSPTPNRIYSELGFHNCPSSHPFLPYLQTTLFSLDIQMLGEK